MVEAYVLRLRDYSHALHIRLPSALIRRLGSRQVVSFLE